MLYGEKSTELRSERGFGVPARVGVPQASAFSHCFIRPALNIPCGLLLVSRRTNGESRRGLIALPSGVARTWTDWNWPAWPVTRCSRCQVLSRSTIS